MSFETSPGPMRAGGARWHGNPSSRDLHHRRSLPGKHPYARLCSVLFKLMAALIVLLLFSAAGFYLRWKENRVTVLEKGSTVRPIPQGNIEYADAGRGPAVLVIHGAPGGYDQGLVYGRELLQRGLRVITVSRPGYLRTPLLTGVTPWEQADALASLLSELGIEQCAVLAVSEGTPCALQLAKRHPGLVTSMALLSPYAFRVTYTEISSVGYRLFHDFTGDLGCWLFSLRMAVDPRSAFAEIIGRDSSLRPSRCNALAIEAMKDPRQGAFLEGLFQSITPLSLREAGIINDNAQLKDPGAFPQGPLETPVLAVYGENDSQTTLEALRDLLKQLPGARLKILTRTGFVLPLGRESGRDWEEISGFLKAAPALEKAP